MSVDMHDRIAAARLSMIAQCMTWNSSSNRRRRPRSNLMVLCVKLNID